MPKFDLAAKVVGAEQAAYVVHAGKGRRNHRSFVENSIAYLEVPNIGLTPPTASSRNSLRRVIRRYHARLLHDLDPSRYPRPRENLSEYQDDSFNDNSFNALAGSVHSLYSKIKPGDIIITPGSAMLGKYRKPIVHFGEVLEAFSADDIFSGGLRENTNVPFRKVRWLSTADRRDVTPALEAQISKPPAVRRIRLENDLADILKLTYSNYIYADGSSSLIKADSYEAKQFAILNDASDLIALLIAGYAYANASRDGDVSQIDDLAAFKRKYLAQSGVENIEISFASPGAWRIIGASAAMAMFVALGIGILTSDLSSAQMQSGIEVVNKVSASSPMDQELQESIDIFLQSLPSGVLDEIKSTAVEANGKIGFKSSVKQIR